jgi:hypothetical protein
MPKWGENPTSSEPRSVSIANQNNPLESCGDRQQQTQSRGFIPNHRDPDNRQTQSACSRVRANVILPKIKVAVIVVQSPTQTHTASNPIALASTRPSLDVVTLDRLDPVKISP